MKPLVREALEINKELDGVIFVGAIARYFHTNVMRESEDIDVAIVMPISEKELEDKATHQTGGKKANN